MKYMKLESDIKQDLVEVLLASLKTRGVEYDKELELKGTINVIVDGVKGLIVSIEKTVKKDILEPRVNVETLNGGSTAENNDALSLTSDNTDTDSVYGDTNVTSSVTKIDHSQVHSVRNDSSETFSKPKITVEDERSEEKLGGERSHLNMIEEHSMEVGGCGEQETLIQHQPVKKKRRLYDPDNLAKAIHAVLEDGQKIRTAARLFNIPPSTLGDRFNGKVPINSPKPGIKPLLSNVEEKSLLNHIKYMESIGYTYTRREVMALAGDYTVSIGKKEPGKSMSQNWFYNFMCRWPELKALNPSGIEIVKDNASNPVVIERYFSELQRVLEKFDLLDKPECIYSLDEKGINYDEKSTRVVERVTDIRKALVSPSATVTLIGCGNANGISIPPYFIFKGTKFVPEVLSNTMTGTSGIVSGSDWSNSKILRTYLESHFLKYSEGSGTKIILFDAHKLHIDPDTIGWALEQNIVLFVLPPYTSLVLQPLDVACFGQFSLLYNDEATVHITSHRGQKITRGQVASIACKCYSLALSAISLKKAFQKCGIFPFDPQAYYAS